jgi:sugar porter (SP) family MFS transporter
MSYPSFYQEYPMLDTATTKGALKRHNSLLQGVGNGMTNLGGAFACLIVLYYGNRLGRRKMSFIGGVITIIGTVIFCTSYSFAQILVSRFIQGIGIGIGIATVPVWQSELATTKNRSAHVIVDGIMVSAGFMIASWITYGFSKANTFDSWQWRVPGTLIGIFALPITAASLMFPESPRWLVMQGRADEAREIFADMFKDSEDPNIVENTLNAAVRVNETVSHTSWTGLFRMGKDKMVWRLFLAVTVQWFTQMNGAGIITAYANQLFGTIGLEKDTAKIVASVSLTYKFLTCFIAFFVIERVGRRALFITSGVGMAISMFVLAICGSQTTDTKLAPAYVAIVFVFIFLTFLPLAFLGVNFLYCQEIISTPYRAPAGGISSATLWLSQFILALTTPLSLEVLEWKTYLVWGAASAIIPPVVYLYYPETTNLSMEELEGIWFSPGLRGPVKEAAHLRSLKAQGITEKAVLAGEVHVDDKTNSTHMVENV